MSNQESQKQNRYQHIPDSPPRLSRDFFTRDGLTVAKELLGKILVHETIHGTICGFITYW